MGRRCQGRHPGADQPHPRRAEPGRLSRPQRTGLRRRDQRRCPRVSIAHTRLARNVQRCGRRRAGGAGVLHALRLNSVRDLGRSERLRLLGVPVPLEQADVRPPDELALEPVSRPPGGGSAHWIGARAQDTACGYHEMGGLARSPPANKGPVLTGRESPASPELMFPAGWFRMRV